jgi:hypothetical protein
VRIRALSVFEGIVYHSHPIDTANPCRPTLEVEALVRDGDVDSGPLHLAVAEYAVMVGDTEVGRRCVAELREKGRIVEILGVAYIAFPTWTPVDVEHR